MKRTIILLIGLLLTFVGNGQTKQEQEVLQLSHAKFKWLVQKKTDSLQTFLDERLTYIHSNGWVQTKKDLINDLLSGKLSYDKIEIEKDSGSLLDINEEAILVPAPRQSIPAPQALLLRANRARRIAATLSIKDAEVVEAYARECEAEAWKRAGRSAPQPIAA